MSEQRNFVQYLVTLQQSSSRHHCIGVLIATNRQETSLSPKEAGQTVHYRPVRDARAIDEDGAVCADQLC
jgi:hypothetical protein